MKKILVLIFTLFIGIALVSCNTLQEEGTTILAVDINPSIEFILDEDGNVLSVQFNNEDAEIVGSDLSLIGLPYAEAVELFINAATEAGYIDVNSTNNNIVITVGNEDETKAAEIQTYAKETAQLYLEENKIGGAVLTGEEAYEELTALAEEYEISIGKVRMIQSVLETEETRTFEELAELRMQELALIVKEAHQEKMQEFINERKAEAMMLKEQMKANAQAKIQAHRQMVEDEDIEMPNYDAIKTEQMAQIEAMIEQYRTRANKMKNNTIYQVDPDQYSPNEETETTTTITS